jgi:hypothetical protein
VFGKLFGGSAKSVGASGRMAGVSPKRIPQKTPEKHAHFAICDPQVKMARQLQLATAPFPDLPLTLRKVGKSFGRCDECGGFDRRGCLRDTRRAGG